MTRPDRWHECFLLEHELDQRPPQERSHTEPNSPPTLGLYKDTSHCSEEFQSGDQLAATAANFL